jgi:hypothetical protein
MVGLAKGTPGDNARPPLFGFENAWLPSQVLCKLSLEVRGGFEKIVAYCEAIVARAAAVGKGECHADLESGGWYGVRSDAY